MPKRSGHIFPGQKPETRGPAREAVRRGDFPGSSGKAGSRRGARPERERRPPDKQGRKGVASRYSFAPCRGRKNRDEAAPLQAGAEHGRQRGKARRIAPEAKRGNFSSAWKAFPRPQGVAPPAPASSPFLVFRRSPENSRPRQAGAAAHACTDAGQATVPGGLHGRRDPAPGSCPAFPRLHPQDKDSAPEASRRRAFCAFPAREAVR